ncbi:MAG: DUF1284 domain-containing protein [Oscillospiraceae bacterium]|nr:DUF1284 domain-containing protein [Oscillospiraceae bacterium]
MRLRPHHLLCLPNFVGEGYDGAFCANMAEQKRRLAETGRITLIDGADEVCAACPNGRDGLCAFQDKVRRYDQAVCGILGLVTPFRYEAAELEKRVREEIFEAGRLEEICGDCEWFPLCRGLAEK